tara:strand:- start:43 stop:480 length:438 start_codon:yes stop_codon:yes gene_type:complete
MKKINKISDIEKILEIEDPKLLTDNEIKKLIDQGVTGKFLKDVENTFIICRGELPKLLGMSLKNYKSIIGKKDLLSKKNAKKVLLLVHVMFQGYRTFTFERKFFKWLYDGHMATNYKRPIDLLKTKKGIKETYVLLGRINHGIYS